jgi:phosphopantothenoylcysteine decarboxylase
MGIVVMPFAAQFLQSQTAEHPSLASLLNLPGVDAIYEDPDEWTRPYIRGDEILHIELRRWNSAFSAVGKQPVQDRERDV